MTTHTHAPHLPPNMIDLLVDLYLLSLLTYVGRGASSQGRPHPHSRAWHIVGIHRTFTEYRNMQSRAGPGKGHPFPGQDEGLGWWVDTACLGSPCLSSVSATSVPIWTVTC